MKKEKKTEFTGFYLSSIVLIISIVVLSITIVFGAMLLDFKGLIKINLGINGGELQIDNRPYLR